MSRLARDGTAEPVSRDQILRRVREQGNINFPCSGHDDQDWQPYPFDPYSAICDGHTYIYKHGGQKLHTYFCSLRARGTALTHTVYTPALRLFMYGNFFSYKWYLC